MHAISPSIVVAYRSKHDISLVMHRTNEEKLDLLAALHRLKVPLTAFSENSGVPRLTLHRWKKREQKWRMEAPETKLSLNPGRPRAIDGPFRTKMEAELKSVQAARDADWKAVRSGMNSFRRTRRPRLTLAEAMDVVRAVGYRKSKATLVRFLAEIHFETARKYRYRRGLIGNHRAR
jgi:hypothetical protein